MIEPLKVKVEKSEFRRPLVVQKIGTRTWRVKEALVYRSVLLNAEITVSAGEETDFASVPRGLWNLFPPDGSYTPAAVVHDYLYRKCPDVDRKKCDQVFLEAMEACGTSWFARRTIYAAVRLGGGSSKKKSV